MSKSKPGPKYKLPKRRSPAAQALSDPDLPFKHKVIPDKRDRRDKYRKDRRFDDDDEEC